MSKEITHVSIEILKIHPRNTEFFDDISGEEYENFKRSIQEEGIISEIIVAPDMTIISGHQRYKAAKELGIKMVPIRIREDLIDEDKKLKVLLAANFGRSKNDEAKQRKVAVEYVRLCGYKPGDNQWSAHNGLTLDEIASQLGTSKTNLKRALSIERNLTDSMKELLDTGVITKTLAADVIAALDEDEQAKLILQLDVTQKYTKKQVQQYIDEIRSYKTKIKDLESRKPKEVRVEVDKTDYAKISKLEHRITELEIQKRQLELAAELNKEDAEKFAKLKSDIAFLTKQKDDLGRQIASATELSELTVTLQKVLEKDLAPIKFKRCMEQLDISTTARKNLEDIVYLVDTWSAEMHKYLKDDYNKVINI